MTDFNWWKKLSTKKFFNIFETDAKVDSSHIFAEYDGNLYINKLNGFGIILLICNII